eukprot:scaffold1752_cov296-Ochromonas_danica.AAC.1
MPESYDVEKLCLMHKTCCLGITRSQASFFGGVPSLMYITKIQTAELPATKFSLLHPTICEDQTIFVDFAEALITGEVRYVENQGAKIKWPLCYVQCVARLFPQLPVARDIAACIDILAKDTQTKGDGMAWEQSVRIAILLRFALAVAGRNYGIPFRLCEMKDIEHADITVVSISA